jgi:hypothetical protein
MLLFTALLCASKLLTNELELLLLLLAYEYEYGAVCAVHIMCLKSTSKQRQQQQQRSSKITSDLHKNSGKVVKMNFRMPHAHFH